MKNAISPTRNENFSEWYQQVISHSELAENSPANVDKRDMNGGEKKWYHIKRGVPVRVEVGIKELEQNVVSYSCRNDSKNLMKADIGAFVKDLPRILQTLQKNMLESARANLSNNTHAVTTLNDFKQAFNEKNKLNAFVLAPFVEDEKVEKTIGELGVTVRCIPLDQPKTCATCLFTGQTTKTWALYAKSY
ncbi:prolyl-tRNA synthetase [Pseudomonas lini]|jgi:prolyl-tRNA synthetase|uniref:His/Gly/Thr/Pro-type tRNA ligase C-terminal domain-containing protein n=1 Tax=Pseudomonas lini TaxID=163011 RepID=UPI002784EEB6|nr:His/Gly/Thr/Pro-type tRNA ligase C-terminal domain-containing protein [Pseudomonas lini]MDQ0123262.1 prolyl-tRNA synthetase [Pseudomonas lini]